MYLWETLDQNYIDIPQEDGENPIKIDDMKETTINEKDSPIPFKTKFNDYKEIDSKMKVYMEKNSNFQNEIKRQNFLLTKYIMHFDSLDKSLENLENQDDYLEKVLFGLIYI